MRVHFASASTLALALALTSLLAWTPVRAQPSSGSGSGSTSSPPPLSPLPPSGSGSGSISSPPPSSPPPPDPSLDSRLPSMFNVYPDDGIFEICFSKDCNAMDPSLSFGLGQLGTGTAIDTTTQDVTFTGGVLADFGDMLVTPNDPWITTPTFDFFSVGEAGIVASMHVLTCFTGCVPRSSSASEFAQISSMPDSVGIKLDVHHMFQNGTIPGDFESYDVPMFGLKLHLEIQATPPSGSSAASLSDLALTFLVLASENGTTVTSNITTSSPPVDGKMYLTRIHFGNTMFLDVPTYATVDTIPHAITVVAKAISSGDLQDLIQVTLLFGTLSDSVKLDAAVAASDMTGNYEEPWGFGNMSSTSSSSSSSSSSVVGGAPRKSEDGQVVPTRMFAKSRGDFALCMDPSCTSGGAVALSFTGLGCPETGLKLKRFARSPAFEFGAPKHIYGTSGPETYGTSFVAVVPQSRERPPRIYDDTSGSSDPIFFASVVQYLSTGKIAYAGKQILVPRGALKFEIKISYWKFASPTDTLELNMTVLAMADMAAGGAPRSLGDSIVSTVDGGVVLLLGNGKRLELPDRAVVDNKIVPISIRYSSDPVSGGIIVTFRFPAFDQVLFYDPVVGSDALLLAVTPQPTTAPTATAPPKKGTVESWVMPGILLGLLALIVIVSVIRCTKKVKVKLDFSKIIP